MENTNLNLEKDLTWIKATSSNGNLGMNATFTGVLLSVGTDPQDIKGSDAKYYPATIDLYVSGTDVNDENAKVLKGVSCIIYHNNLFDKEGNPRMTIGNQYAGEITQPINADGTAKDLDAWVTLSHLTATGTRIGKISFGAPSVQQEQADLSQVS